MKACAKILSRLRALFLTGVLCKKVQTSRDFQQFEVKLSLWHTSWIHLAPSALSLSLSLTRLNSKYSLRSWKLTENYLGKSYFVVRLSFWISRYTASNKWDPEEFKRLIYLIFLFWFSIIILKKNVLIMNWLTSRLCI